MDEWLRVRALNAEDIRCTAVGTGEVMMYDRPLKREEVALFEGAGIELNGVWDRVLTREEIEAAQKGEPVAGNRIAEGDFYLIQVGWAKRFPRFASGDLPEGTDRVTHAQWFTYEEARDRFRANRAETPWPFRLVREGRDLKDRFDIQSLPNWERTAARDLRAKMITEGGTDDD